MVRSKAPSKQKSRGVDFKKFKRKLGRRLPPPKNATNTEIKSKAIILPEQSVAADKAGLAVSKKGLTLKELLQQTSHYNSKVRKDALVGIRDLFLKYPEELLSHKLAVMEKLRERISDPDRLVRETLYQLFKSVILPGCKEDNQGAFISLMVAYVFNAMAHLSADVRLMSFKFLELVVQHCPVAFSLNAGKILQGYADILRKNQLHLEEKGKFKIILSGLDHCLSLLPSNEREDACSPKMITEVQTLHAFETDVPKDRSGHSQILGIKDLVLVLVNCLIDFDSWVHSQPALDSQTFDCMLSILHSIDSAVRYFLYEKEKYTPELHASTTPLSMSNDVMHEKQSFPSLLEKLFAVFPLKPMAPLSEKEDDRYLILNMSISEIFFNSCRFIYPPVFLVKFLEFIESLLCKEINGINWSRKALYEKHVLRLLGCIPELLKIVEGGWKARLLQAFTMAFRDCCPQFAVKMAFFSVAEEMLIPKKQNSLYLATDDQETLGHQITWLRELPALLITLGDLQPSSSHAVICCLLRLGQYGFPNPYLAEEYDNLQYSLQEFFSRHNDGDVHYGPFLRLPKDSQELSIYCLRFFSFLDPGLLTSLVSCCFCQDLELSVLLRIIEVLQSAYTSGHIQITDHISFFITLVTKFEVFPGETKISRQKALRQVTGVICSSLSQMGDHSLVFEVLEEIVLETISAELPLDNTCALVRLLTVVDSKPTRLSEQSISKFSNIILGYLIDAARIYPEKEYSTSNYISSSRYYILPCLLLFDRSIKLLKLVISMLGALAIQQDTTPCFRYAQLDNHHSSRITVIVSVFLMIWKDGKAREVLSSCRVEIYNMLHNVLSLQSEEEVNMSIEQRHKARHGVEQLKTAISAISPEFHNL
ncbi:hypothetical protein Dimus_001835 [Dionaea muscipula]